jgi:hypothetical protein
MCRYSDAPVEAGEVARVAGRENPGECLVERRPVRLRIVGAQLLDVRRDWREAVGSVLVHVHPFPRGSLVGAALQRPLRAGPGLLTGRYVVSPPLPGWPGRRICLGIDGAGGASSSFGDYLGRLKIVMRLTKQNGGRDQLVVDSTLMRKIYA